VWLVAVAAVALATAGAVRADRAQGAPDTPASAGVSQSPGAPASPTTTRTASPGRPAAAPSDLAALVASDQALVQKYCLTCHNARVKTGNLSLDGMSPADAGQHAEIWEKVVRKLRGGMMPPQGMPRPDAPVVDAFASRLELALDRHAARSPDPGHKPVHRLNRTEYGNAIRDLLDLEIDPASLLPADDESNGFDNIAGVLRVSPSLLEQYLGAARQISSLAVGSDTGSNQWVFRVAPDTDQADHVEGLPLGTRGGLLIEHNFPQDAEYDVSVLLLRNIVGYMIGLEFAHQLEISVDGERAFLTQVGGEEDNKASDENMSEAADMIDARLKTRIKIAAGPRKVAVTFIERNGAESDEPLQPHRRDHDLQNMNGIPRIEHVKIDGPFAPTGPGDTPSRRRIFACRPTAPTAEATCAQKILSSLARRAYRRPVTTADMEPVLEMYKAGRAKGGFEAGVESGLRLILSNPKFLFRAETPPAAGQLATVSDLELASRLSFFLWSSLPDDELLTTAAAGRLSRPAVLRQQVRRMLADRKSQQLVENFAGQWLLLRNLRSHNPNGPDFPDWDNDLREAFRSETELFFGSIVRDDRSVLDLLNADYTFVNERLARHYGIPGVYGSHFRRVTLPGEERRGLLGQGSILTVTSYPNRTSPVLRGKWILENITGTPPPPPPPNVPALDENDAGVESRSVRERLEAHRRTPACASCHRVMDPLGFALENFDGIGEWRVREPGGTVDPSGQLGDGTQVDGPVALRRALSRRPEQFIRTLTEKMMTYGLGRGVDYQDMPTVRAIAASTARQDYRMSALILGIVRSPAFQMKKGAEAAPKAALRSPLGSASPPQRLLAPLRGADIF
jgi:mono/diheme cytochrome c family protein